MNFMSVTDIYGNKINNNNIPFILLHIKNPYFILKKKDTSVCNQIDSLWEFIPEKLSYVLKRFGLNDFYPLGHLWYPESTITKKSVFLFVNGSISKYPNDYIKISAYGSGYIWKPIAPNNYEPLGLLFSEKKPSINEVRVIPNKYTKVFNNNIKNIGNNISMNEYNYLGHINQQKLTIKKDMFLDKNNIPIHTINGNIITYNKKTNERSNINLNNKNINDTDSTTSWSTPKGKFVMLVEPDEPWYIKKNNQNFDPEMIKVKSLNDEYPGDIIDNITATHGLFKSNFGMDYTKPHLGYGHNYKSRLFGKDCKCIKDTEIANIETFNEGNKITFLSKTINLIMIFLFLLIIVILICRFYIELKTKK